MEPTTPTDGMESKISEREIASRRAPSRINRWLLRVEWFVVFAAVPTVAFLDVFQVSKFTIFSVPVLYGLLVYRFSSGYPHREERSRLPLAPALARIGVISGLLALYAYGFHRDEFLNLPRERPQLWMMICLLYPFLSALPQEFLYRQFYFWRYRGALPAGRWGILVNAAVFAYLHLMYDNWVAIVLTFAGGLLFAWTYLATRSLAWPWVEHAVYGLAVFTFGLGAFFYEPVG